MVNQVDFKVLACKVNTPKNKHILLRHSYLILVKTVDVLPYKSRAQGKETVSQVSSITQPEFEPMTFRSGYKHCPCDNCMMHLFICKQGLLL